MSDSNKIPGARRYCDEMFGKDNYHPDFPHYLKEFTKMHVKKALEKGFENNYHGISYEDYIKAYPLKNIK